MTSWEWKAYKIIASVVCGAVVLFGPSEVDALAIGQALPRLAALAILAVISVASALALARNMRVKTCALRVAALNLIAYALIAGLLKGLVALPTAGFVGIVGLMFLNRAAALTEQRRRLAGER